VLLKHIRPVRPAPTRLRENGALSARLVEAADAAEIERAGHPQRPSAQRPKPPKPLPKYSGWQADKRAMDDCIAQHLRPTSGWTQAELAAQPAWQPTFEQLATAHFTEQKQAGWFRDVDGVPREQEPTRRQVAEMLAVVVPLLVERRAKVRAQTAAAAATRKAANTVGMQHARKLREAEAKREADMQTKLTAAVAADVHIEWVDSATGDRVRALSLSGDLRRLASVERWGNGLLAKVRVTAAGLSQVYIGQRPSTGAGTSFQGSVAEWKAKLKEERPGGSGAETEWGRQAWAAWQEDDRNKDRSVTQQKADPAGSAALPLQQGYAPLRHLLADGPDGDQVFVGAMPANALRDGRRNSTPHHTLLFRVVPGLTHKARGPCGLVALQHATQHSAESLGLVASQTQQSFDGLTGLASLLGEAKTALGKTFSLAKWHQGLDEALTSRGTERLVIYCQHGDAEDVQNLANLVADCRQQEALQAAERAAVERVAAERASAAGKRRGCKRALPLRRATLREVASRAGIEVVGHYVVLDLSLGIMYTEPEVYVVSTTERREPALLRAALMRPPFQLIFETDTVAAQHTRVLMLDVLARSAAQSNYSNPTLLALLKEDCLAFRRARQAAEAKARLEAQAKR
jgi:hypothetical protein